MPAPPTAKPHTRVGDICEPRRLVQSVRPRVVCEANAAGVSTGMPCEMADMPVLTPPSPAAAVVPRSARLFGSMLFITPTKRGAQTEGRAG